MRQLRHALTAVIVFTFVLAPAAAFAAPPAVAAFGNSWDGTSHDLQHIVDQYIGVPGAINVTTDYIGAHDGDIDPWFWIGNNIPALLVTEVAGNADFNEVGWYLENGGNPSAGFVPEGVIFQGSKGPGASALVVFPTGVTKFGFYLNTHAIATTPTGTHEQVFFTNRKYNDLGPNGAGAIHAPFDGDIQALVFDVSRWKNRANTYLICFEDLDSGAAITPCCTGTDDDYNDFVFQVTALGATPAQTLTFGQLKARYR
jgi:hypothetical protein